VKFYAIASYQLIDLLNSNLARLLEIYREQKPSGFAELFQFFSLNALSGKSR